eukprot:9007598-Pyramimonas_sp.AAC.1
MSRVLGGRSKARSPRNAFGYPVPGQSTPQLEAAIESSFPPMDSEAFDFHVSHAESARHVRYC